LRAFFYQKVADMATELKNLSSFDLSKVGDCSALQIGIVTADWNAEITHSLRTSCEQTLIDAGVKSENIHHATVPGSFELPLGAKYLESKHKLNALICLGCVIKGETSHNEYINQSVAAALMQLSIMRHKPFVFGVLTPNTQEQALDRAGGKHGNKGAEAAFTALAMCALAGDIKEQGAGIGFKRSV
jgi:6,7-dimethyl-8-ribityllumazine synthase